MSADRDAHLEYVPHVMYRFYDDERRLLYIGITSNLKSRLDAHLKDKHWFRDLAYIAVEHHDTRTAALEAERRAIVTEQPVHNVAHGGGEGDPFLGRPRHALRVSDLTKADLEAVSHDHWHDLCLRVAAVIDEDRDGEVYIGHVEAIARDLKVPERVARRMMSEAVTAGFLVRPRKGYYARPAVVA